MSASKTTERIAVLKSLAKDGPRASPFAWLRRLLSRRDREVEDVRRLHEKFGILYFEDPGLLAESKLKERYDFMREELDEFRDACLIQDMEGMLDALLDLVYVAKGTALMLGLGSAWREAWAEVQRANMAKERGVNPRRRHAVDLVKPPGWVPPLHRPILRAHGYDEAAWADPSKHRKDM